MSDSSIPPQSTDRALRRVARWGDEAMIGTDEGTGDAYVKPNAFKFDPDCSTYRLGVLHANGLNSTTVLRTPQNVVLGLSISAVEDAGFTCADTPWPRGTLEEGGEEVDVAHFSIYLPEGWSKGQSRRALAELATIDIHP